MTSRDFCFWLQGFIEISEQDTTDASGITADQLVCIRKHLDMVFVHEIDPSMGDKEHQDALNKLHNKVNAMEHRLPPPKMRC
jgi:hypothetical protein